MSISPEWVDIIAEVVESPGVAMVIGAVDAGKTHFCVQLANAGLEAGLPTAVVDADIGQSEIGAPGTVGMALADRAVESLSEFRPKRLYFVGNTTPAGHMLESAVGTRKMVDAALGLGAKLVVVDTTGMVEGPLGRKLKTYKTDLVRPNYIIGIQKQREIEPLLVPFTKVNPVKVRRVSSTSNAQRKPAQFRAAKRQLSFYKHFYEAPGHIIHLDDVCCWNTWFRSGRPMKWQYFKFIEDAIACKVLHAEITGGGLFIVVERPCRPKDISDIEQQFKTSNITVAVNETFQGLLVGLADENGNTLNVGLVQAVDFKQKFMFVLSPMRTISPVRVVQFGSIRLGRDGQEFGAVRPGDL